MTFSLIIHLLNLQIILSNFFFFVKMLLLFSQLLFAFILKNNYFLKNLCLSKENGSWLFNILPRTYILISFFYNRFNFFLSSRNGIVNFSNIAPHDKTYISCGHIFFKSINQNFIFKFTKVSTIKLI